MDGRRCEKPAVVGSIMYRMNSVFHCVTGRVDLIPRRQ